MPKKNRVKNTNERPAGNCASPASAKPPPRYRQVEKKYIENGWCSTKYAY